MSALANLFGFGNTGNQETQQTQQTTQTNDQNVPGEQATQETTPQGLDQFSALATAELKPVETFDPSKLFNVDPAKMNEEVGKMNFLEGAITQEQLAKIQEGGEGSMAAMLQVMNQVARQAFARSAALSTAVTSNALSQSLPHVETMMGQTLEQARLQDAVEAVNPALAHPVGKMFLKETMPRLRQQYPKATNIELANHANELFKQFASAINPAAPTKAEEAKAAEVDWNDWLNT